MLMLFLDTHIWNYLVEHEGSTDEQLEHARERLIDGVRKGEWAVTCSLPVLQEIIRIYRNNPQKYELIKNLVFESVGHRWLLDMKDRYVAELYNGGILPLTSRYLGREQRRKVKRLANSKTDVLDIDHITYVEGLAFKESQEEARKKVFIELGSVDGAPPKKINRAYEHWFANDRDLKGWVLKVVEGGIAKKLFPASMLKGFIPTYLNCPTAWSYVDFRQAKILLNLGHARAIKDSDVVDADIYGCSPYYDMLITDDRFFIESINLVNDGRFKLHSFEQLLKMLS